MHKVSTMAYYVSKSETTKNKLEKFNIKTKMKLNL